MADTRKDRRAPVSLKVRFKSATVDEFIEHYCKDVSRGGIFIKSSQPMAIGTLLKFQFQLKDESSLIKGVGRVVWTRSPDDAVADQPAGMGIKFIKMDNDSRAIVDRIVEGQGEEGGAFDEGRATASQSETQSERPQAPAESFFPDVGPAELPPPEDRTAVRQAAQFLAAALAEGGTDEAAAQEAEQKAEEARQRTAQIEAERLAEAQHRASGADASLPSMIIDPSLGPSESKPPEPSAEAVEPSLPPPSPNLAQSSAKVEAPRAVSTPPAEAKVSSSPPSASTSSLPPASTRPTENARKSPLLPAAILIGVLLVAAWAFLRRPAEPEPPLTAQPEPVEPAKVEPAEPEPAEELAAAAPEALDAGEAPPEEPVEVPTVEVDVRTVPPRAEVLVAGELQGKAPLKVQLPMGVETLVTARARAYAESSQSITPGDDGNKPLRFSLVALPYVLRVNTTPEAAKISVGAKRGSAGEEIELGTGLHGMLGIIARLPGYQTARAPLRVDDFEQTADKMVATVDLTLEPAKVAQAPKPERLRPDTVEQAPEKPAAPEPDEESAQDSGSTASPTQQKPAPVGTDDSQPAADKPAAEKPAPAEPSEAPSAPPAPKLEKKPSEGEPLPDNPFG